MMKRSHRALHIGRSTSSRKVVTYRSGHFTGWVPSRKNGRVVQYESILERDYIQLIEADPGVESYTEQPTAMRWDDGDRHYETTFDFEVKRIDGSKYLAEVKPLAKVQKYGLDDLYGHARAHAKKNKYSDLELWTEREIRAMPRLANAELMISSKTGVRDAAFEARLYLALSKLSERSDRATIREIRAASMSQNGEPSIYWEIIRAVARGELVPESECALLDDRAVLMFEGFFSSSARKDAI